MSQEPRGLMPWDDARLDAVESEARACRSDDACTSDVLALVNEVRRLRSVMARSAEQAARLYQAAALLNSMVLSGESHSDVSRAAVRAAMDAP